MIKEIIQILEAKQWSSDTAKKHTIAHLNVFEYCRSKNRMKAWNEVLMYMSYMFKEDSKNITLPFSLYNDINRRRELDAIRDKVPEPEVKETAKRGRRKAATND
jgi:hypothetical protein